MHPMLNIAIRAARKAGNHIAKSLENAEKIESTQKGVNDFVTNVDKEAEAIIIDTIKASYPDHTVIGEESGLLQGKDDEVQWIIDPLDGTTNFVKGLIFDIFDIHANRPYYLVCVISLKSSCGKIRPR